MQNFGIRDVPVESIEYELLGIGQYINSLSEFIVACETPMTISIQGDWGCGKTSAMNMIKEKIADDVVSIWFNTWQFSQFDMQRELSISLLTYFVDELDDEKGTFKKKVGGFLKGIGKMALAVAADQVVSGVVADKIDGMNGAEIDVSKALKNLKEELHKAVEQKLKVSGKERIVVFIDDLDRLQPEKAVEMLEVMKLFLDLPKCVFVLAVDYSVVIRGVRKKYGDDIGDEKGRSFFDKIIQLPFNMPIAQYDLTKYFTGLLQKTGIDFSDDDVDIYRDLASYSIGINPRGLKRIFNLMLLLNITAKNQNLLENVDDVQKSERQRVIFAVLCLQNGFEEAYGFLAKQNITEEFLRQMSDVNQLKTNSVFENLRKLVSIQEKLEKLAEFMEIFINSLQIKADGKDELSISELKNLSEIFKFSSITTVEDIKGVSEVSYEERKQNREAIKAFADELNSSYKDKFESLKDKLTRSSFITYQSKNTNSVSMYMSINNNGFFNIEFIFDGLNCSIAMYCSGSKANIKAGMEFVNSNLNDFGFNQIVPENWTIHSEDFNHSMSFEQKLEKFKTKVKSVVVKVFGVLEYGVK